MRRHIAGAVGAVLALGALLPLAGCSDMLAPKVYGSLTPETFFSSEKDFNSAVVALYAPFKVDWGDTDQGVNTWYASLYNADNKTYWAQSEEPTDELYFTYAAAAPIENFTWGPATFNGSATYVKIRYVARATDVIDKLQNSTAPVPDAVKARYIAESKALRGWLNWVLYDFFGPVNSKMDAATLSSTDIDARPTAQVFATAIEKDLTDALAGLPDKYNGDATNWGRMSKGAVRGILLRLYLHEKNWAKVEAVGRDVMGMGYSLRSDYGSLCSASMNSEILYAIPATAAAPNWYFMEAYPQDFKSAAGTTRSGVVGWNSHNMPWTFYQKFDPADQRRSTILSTYTNTGNKVMTKDNGMAGAIPMKCTGADGGTGGAAMDWPVFRYAEVLLDIAEAVNEQGRTGEAFQYVNQVRARAGLGAWSGLSQGALRDSLLDERGRELYAEGVRRDDLIRAGKFISFAKARGASAQDFHVLFPIPSSVITEGAGKITQNAGY